MIWPILLLAAAIVFVGLCQRYEVIEYPSVSGVLRIDRLTGTTEVCSVLREEDEVSYPQPDWCAKIQLP